MAAMSEPSTGHDERLWACALAVLPALLRIRWEESMRWIDSHEESSKLRDPSDCWHQFEDQIGTCTGGFGDSCLPIYDNPAVMTAFAIARQMIAAADGEPPSSTSPP